MGADFCNPPTNTQARANASFAVFHYRRNADPVLVCFTEEMCLASHYDMPFWFQKKTTAVDSSKVLKICADVPVKGEAWNVWHRIVTSNGTDVMPGAPDRMNNSMHGEINTQGCWMVFRNYNWPRANYDAFEEAYRRFYRNEADPCPLFREQLNALGYSTNGICSQENYEKATEWDKNRAYTRFIRHIVGIKYFSRNLFHSLYNTDGEHFDPSATQEYTNALVPGKNSHDFQLALVDPTTGISATSDIVTAPDSLFDDSRLNFKRQQRWAPTLTRNKVTQPSECSWVDLVLFE
jgi:hypothetical protein